jgi:hypothetical protein
MSTLQTVCSIDNECDRFPVGTPLDDRRVIIRRHDGDVEMVQLPWGDCAR